MLSDRKMIDDVVMCCLAMLGDPHRRDLERVFAPKQREQETTELERVGVGESSDSSDGESHSVTKGMD